MLRSLFAVSPMRLLSLLHFLVLGSIVIALSLTLINPSNASARESSDEIRLLRFPDIHEDFVVFVYAGDIWRASSSGGSARRLTSHHGLELFPKISRDGEWVAFTAEYTGMRQVYVMPAAGGTPKQLTFYNDVGSMPPRGGWDNWIQGWTPDGKILVRMNRTHIGVRYGQYWLVDPSGGLEVDLGLPHAGSGCMSPDGTRLVYTPIDREFRTWKRTRGGRAQDIWIYDLQNNRSERLTTDPGTDNFSMWLGNEIFFTSDREGTLNLFAYDLATKNIRKITDHDDYDVLWPSLGPDAIVYMKGGFLYRLDPETGTSARIPIRIANDLPLTVPHFKNVRDNIASADLSPSGARAVFEARGDLFSVPAKHGPTRNLTRTQGIRERDPAWSPDGRWIAYLSDATGEYEVYVRSQDGTGEARQMTRDNTAWIFAPVWSPDSERLAYADRNGALNVLDIESGAVTVVDRAERDGDLEQYSWAPDGQWLVYSRNHPSRLPGIALFSLQEKTTNMLGDGLTADFSPTFSHDGKHLFFLSNRDYQLTFSDFEFNYLYNQATRVYVASLDPQAEALFPLKSDEEETSEDEENDSGGEDGSQEAKAKKKDPVSLNIEPEGFVSRTLALPGLTAGDYNSLQAHEGAVFYIKVQADGSRGLYRYDLEEQKESEVLAGVRSYRLAADGKKLLYSTQDDWGIAGATAGHSAGEGVLDLDGLSMKLDPRAEWKQIYADAWRVGRDWFYDSRMHGADWLALRERYGALVPHVAERGELDFILGELIGELEAGHCYVMTGDLPEVDRVEGALLGCLFEAHSSGYYRISHIYAGENWDNDWRSPLTEPGVQVNEGDFLLAIDGQELKTSDNPYRLLENKGQTQVLLTVHDKPSLDGARTESVRPITSELNLRYLEWVKGRMQLADELSDGRVGYIHLPNTSTAGNRMLQKLFYSQSNKPALIVDDRFNGGGFIPDRMIEYFARTTLVYWARRGVQSMRTPGFAHDGPKAMLINSYAASGGDALPHFFRLEGLGPLVGTRTWGGLIGLSGNPMCVDGGGVLYPTFRLYDREGAWQVENEGVSPDYEVIDLPELLLRGEDPSLEKAVMLLLEELEKGGPTEPESPTPPDMHR